MRCSINNPKVKNLVIELENMGEIDSGQYIAGVYLEDICANGEDAKSKPMVTDHHDKVSVIGCDIALDIMSNLNDKVIDVVDITLSSEGSYMDVRIKDDV